MKINKVLISIAMIFSALLSTIALASDETSVTVSNLQGTGTQEDPYVIPGDVTFKANKIPFYFTIQTPGVYQVFWSVDNEVTFTCLQTGKEDVSIKVNSLKRTDSNNWQLGVKTVANTTPTGATPAYAIRECSVYYPKQEGKYVLLEDGVETISPVSLSIYNTQIYEVENKTTWLDLLGLVSPNYGTAWLLKKLFSDKVIELNGYFYECDENGIPSGDPLVVGGPLGDEGKIKEGQLFYNMVEKNKNVVQRQMTLFNATYETERGGYDVTSGDYYYFTNSSEGLDLYKSIGYEQLGDDYFLYNETFQELGVFPAVISLDSSKPVQIVYQFAGNYEAPADESDEAGWLETQIVNLLMAFGDKFLLEMVRDEKVLGPTLSIDTLIFDEYERTKLSLYDETSSDDNVMLTIKKTVNFWFDAFKILTYVVYMIILVYTGIMIILNAGTGKQDKWKAYLGNWVMGIVLLNLVPKYGIPYLFKINTAFVSYVGQGHDQMQSYYNNYDVQALQKKYKDIMGSDSATISVEELAGLKEELEEEKSSVQQSAENNLRSTYSEGAKQLKERLKEEYVDRENIDKEVDEYIEDRLDYIFKFTNEWIEKDYTDEKIEELLVAIYMPREIRGDPFATDMRRYFADVFLEPSSTASNGYVLKSDVREAIVEYHRLARDIGLVDQVIEANKTDLMGMMRAYAGKYHRIVFALLWYVLFFQLISLAIIYFKRLFMVAILIAIFPLIMMSYAIDKMGDGKSQTLSLWLKELLANVFLQSVHAVIYVVLIEMGLEIYAADQTNWMLLMASVFMLIPAEALMKEIFDLNGSTTGKLGGALMGTLTAIGSAAAIARSWKGKRDESVTKKNNERFNKLQNSQARADIKAQTRKNKRDAARASGQPVKYSAFRENMYAAASNVRSATAKVAPHVDNVVRNVKNVAAVTAGTAVAIAGGDTQSIAQGAQIANAITGKGKKLDEDKVNIKSELSSAYKRNRSSIQAEKASEKARRRNRS